MTNNKTKILITGIAGFVGSHLLDYLLENKKEYCEIYGIVRENASLERITHNLSKINLITCDLINAYKIAEIIKTIRPAYIYHLAGESSVKTSWDSVVSIVNNNILAGLNILEALRFSKNFECKVLLICSSDEYGVVNEKNIPINEEVPLNPISPYAVSKATIDMFGFQYFSSYGLQIIRIRAFNHTGPRRPEIYALSNFAKQIAEIEKGKNEPIIKVGNLEAIRDYTDVRDIVRGYILAMQYCEPGEVYNLCSSQGYKIGGLLQKLISLSKNNIKIINDLERMRPVDLPVIIGDNSKFIKTVPWKPNFCIEKTLEDILAYWRSKV